VDNRFYNYTKRPFFLALKLSIRRQKIVCNRFIRKLLIMLTF